MGIRQYREQMTLLLAHDVLHVPHEMTDCVFVLLLYCFYAAALVVLGGIASM